LFVAGTDEVDACGLNIAPSSWFHLFVNRQPSGTDRAGVLQSCGMPCHFLCQI